MSRLIDADALLQEFEIENVARNSDIWHITGIKAFIENAPTAFDTEKVVEQIHDKYCHKCRNILGKHSSEEYCKSVKCEIDALCDIVKKGGVE